MPTFHITSPEGKTYEISAPEGATQADAVTLLQKQIGMEPTKPSKPFGQQVNEGIADIPRQIGLTARHALNGAGSLVGMLSDPIGAVINVATGSHLQPARSLTNNVADAIGLPKPANATERIVGDATELMANGAGMTGLASKGAQILTGGAKTVAQALAANPLQQTASAGAAGAAGGYTRETGGNDGAQFLASLAGGVAAPYALNKGQQLAASGNKLLQRAMNPAAAQPLAAQVDVHINNALASSGLTIGDLPANIQAGIRNDVQQAMNMQGVLSPCRDSPPG
jgi:hypothetical protein